MPTAGHMSGVAALGHRPARRRSGRVARRAARGAPAARGAGGAARCPRRTRRATSNICARRFPARPLELGTRSSSSTTATSTRRARGLRATSCSRSPRSPSSTSSRRSSRARRSAHASTARSTLTTARSSRPSRPGDEDARGREMHDHVEFLGPYYEKAWRDVRGRDVTDARFGIQGSGQLVGGAARPPGCSVRSRERAEELGYDSIWAGDHVSFENPILDVTVALCHVRGSHEPDHDRRRHRPASVAPARARRQGVRLARLPLRRPRRARRRRGRRGPAGLRGRRCPDRTSVELVQTRRCWCCVSSSPTRRPTSRVASPASPASRSSHAPPGPVGRHSGSAGARPQRCAAPGGSGDGWLPIWVSPERYADRLE